MVALNEIGSDLSRLGVKVAFAIHAYYPDVFEEILSYLADLPLNKKYFVTTVAEHEYRIRRALQASGQPFQLDIVTNRGRDVLPFWRIYPGIRTENFEYIIKVHTKKSPHLKNGSKWRDSILANLISPEAFLANFIAFKDDAGLGIICPEGFYLPIEAHLGPNEDRVLSIASRLGLTRSEVHQQGFCAGTMFAARVSALDPLLRLKFDDQEFEQEAGQVDGTLAHALERCMTLGTVRNSMRVAVTSNPTATARFNSAAEFAGTLFEGASQPRFLAQIREQGRKLERKVRHMIRGRRPAGTTVDQVSVTRDGDESDPSLAGQALPVQGNEAP